MKFWTVKYYCRPQGAGNRKQLSWQQKKPQACDSNTRVVWSHTRQSVAFWKARVSAKQTANTPRSFGAAWLAAKLTLCSNCCAWPGGSAGIDAVLTSCSTLNVIATAAALLAVTAAPIAAFCIANCCHSAALPCYGKANIAVTMKVQAAQVRLTV